MPAVRPLTLSLPRVPRGALTGLRAVARWAASAPWTEALTEASRLLGEPMRVQLGDVSRFGDESPPPDEARPGLLVLLARAGSAPGAGEVAAVELEASWAMDVVGRVLGGAGDDDAVPRPMTARGLAVARGALLYAAARLLAASGDLGGWVVADVMVGRDAALGRLRARGPGGLVVASLRGHVGGTAGRGWIWWREPDVPMPGRPGDGAARRLAELGSCPMRLRVEAGRGMVRWVDLRALAPGDVLLPDRWSATVDERGRVRGAVVLRAPGGTGWALEAEVDDRGLRVVRRTTRRAWGSAMGTGRRMTEEVDTATGEPLGTEPGSTTTPTRPGGPAPASPWLEAADDLPVSVAIELARFDLPLGELVRTQPGEVLATDVRVGGRARLTVGDRVVATGELVDVDGAIGVRILRIAADEGAEG